MSDGVSRTGYLTLREGAEWLGMGSTRAAARQLQRLVEAMERRDGREIMIRRGTGPGSRLFVTKAILRSYLPEHWAARDKVVGVVRDRFRAIDGELQRGRVERRVLGRKLAEVTREVERMRDGSEASNAPGAPARAQSEPRGSAPPKASASGGRRRALPLT